MLRRKFLHEEYISVITTRPRRRLTTKASGNYDYRASNECVGKKVCLKQLCPVIEVLTSTQVEHLSYNVAAHGEI